MAKEPSIKIPGFVGLGLTPSTKGEIVITRVALTPEVYFSLEKDVQSVLWISMEERDEAFRFLHFSDDIKRLYRIYGKVKYLRHLSPEPVNTKELEEIESEIETILKGKMAI